MPNHPKTIEFKEWRGLNNKTPSERIAENFLTEATNVDIDSMGSIRMRKGYTEIISGTNSHSLWSDGYYNAFYVDDGTLYRIDPNDTTTRTAIAVNLSNHRVSYIQIGSRTYYNSIGGDTGVIENNDVRSWGIAPPSLPPFLTSTTGQLTAGEYHVTLRYKSSTGQVSGGGVQGSISLTNNNSGILVSGIQVPTNPSISDVDIFVSTPNGEVLYLAETVSVGTTSITIDNLWGDMNPLEYQFCFQAPAGELLQEYDGRVYIANGNRLWYSKPHAYEHFGFSDYIEFEGEITNVMPVDDGMFVTADMLYFLEGSDPAKFNVREREPVKGIKYTGVEMMGGDILMENIPTGLKWLFTSDKGIMMVGTGGLVFNLTERNVMIDNAEKGAAIFRSQDGMNQYLSVLKDPMNNRLHIGDSVTADIIRNGIVIT